MPARRRVRLEDYIFDLEAKKITKRGKRSQEARLNRSYKGKKFNAGFNPNIAIKNFDAPHLIGKKIKLSKSKTIGKLERDTYRFQAKKCPICDWGDYPEALIIHHKNHNRKCNHYTNLIVLCRNCHYLVHLGLKECP